MGSSPLCVLMVATVLGSAPSPRQAIELNRLPPGAELGAEDARFLDWLIEDFVFDPSRAAAFVKVEVEGPFENLFLRNGRVILGNELRVGWLVRGTNGDPDRVYFTDGESIPAPATGLRQLPFPPRAVTTTPRSPYGANPHESQLVLAAWLHRRGHDRLAAAALADYELGADAVERVRERLADHANRAAVRAFLERRDTEALSHAARLYTLYPDLADNGNFLAGVVAAEINRRHRAGIGSRQPPGGPPAEFCTWDTGKMVAFLISSLDEAEHAAPLFEFEPEADWRVEHLVRLGDAAVPALIDALESDHRLTRQNDRMEAMLCGNARGIDRHRRPVPVRAVVQTALRKILHTTDYDPTGPTRNRSEEPSPAEEVARLRGYWAEYGKLPPAERMMAILTDPRARPAARYQAARVLTYELDAPCSWSRDDRRGPVRPAGTAFRFERPTVAEAVLVALDDARTKLVPEHGDRWFADAADRYARCLADLGDPRIAPELARRAAAAPTPGERLAFAQAAHRLGVSGPMAALCREVASGKVRLPAPSDGKNLSAVYLRDLLTDLLQAGSPDADDALFAVADPNHPYFHLAAHAVLVDPHFRSRQTEWNTHPVCIAVLRAGLADRRPTGGHSYRRGTDVEDCEAGRRPEFWTPPGRADPEHWFEHVEHRGTDDAMARLSELVVGLPEYHPLRRDADRLIADTREQLARFARSYRPMTREEQTHFGRHQGLFIPDIRPLGRPATAADVAAGRAVFSLTGAKVADGPLPGWLVLKADAKTPDPAAGRVVQAEIGPDGVIVYGVIFRREIRAVRAPEVERVEPLETR